MVGAYGMEIKGTSELRFSKFGGPIEIVGAEDLPPPSVEDVICRFGAG